jgi:predicted transport protein
LWKKATVKADEVLEENPDKKYYSFKEKRWLATTKNREAINQLRLMLDSGEATDWAALQAA